MALHSTQDAVFLSGRGENDELNAVVYRRPATLIMLVLSSGTQARHESNSS